MCIRDSDAGHQRGLLAAHESAGAQLDVQIKMEARAEDIVTQQAVFPGLADGHLQTVHRDGILRTHINVCLLYTSRCV